MAIKWGVIGCGGIARRRTIPGMQECEQSELLAIMDVDATAVLQVADEYGVAGRYEGVDALLADPNVEAVYIASPAHLHKSQVTRAADAHKHILCEKPLATTLIDATEMVEYCENAGVYLTEGYMMKFHSLNRRAKKLVEQGKIGKPVFARAQLSCWYPPIDGAWRQAPALGGGGALIDMATHLYDLLQDMLGPITEVFAYCNSVAHDYPVEDSATTLLRFDNGVHAAVDTFFNIPDTAVFSRLELYGTAGSILAEGTIGQTPGGSMAAFIGDQSKGYDAMQSHDGQDVVRKRVRAKPVNMYAAEIDELSECIIRKRPPTISTGRDGLRIARITEAAYESARTGSSVSID